MSIIRFYCVLQSNCHLNCFYMGTILLCMGFSLSITSIITSSDQPYRHFQICVIECVVDTAIFSYLSVLVVFSMDTKGLRPQNLARNTLEDDDNF